MKWSDYVNQNSVRTAFNTDGSWAILSDVERNIKKKIEAIGTPLKEWDIRINYGIKTGCNEAFIINGATKDQLIAEDPKSAEIIRPILRGKDIKRYSHDFKDLWLITTHNGYEKEGIAVPPVDIKNYPAVKKHLDSCWDVIKDRGDQGCTPYNLRNCTYMDDFSKRKIIYPETTQGANFVLDEAGFMIDKTCFMLLATSHLHFLQIVLSSSLYEYAYKHIFSSIELGTSAYQYNKHALIKLPVYMPEEAEETELLAKAGDLEACDEIVYAMYDISEQEATYIKKDFSRL